MGCRSTAGREDAGNGEGKATLRLRVSQGVEMARPSLLLAEADTLTCREGLVVGAVRIGGSCVPMMEGSIFADAVRAL